MESRSGPKRKLRNTAFRRCAVCKVTFATGPSDVPYCDKRDSRHGRYRSYLKDRSLENIACEWCGCSFQLAHADLLTRRAQGRPVVCSGRCLSLKRGTKVEIPCAHCGRMVLKFASDLVKYPKTYCSTKCVQAASIFHETFGEKHYRYIDGSTMLWRGHGWNFTRRRIRKRDNHTCQLCSVTEKELGKVLDVHHIKPFREFRCWRAANRDANLISLCAVCHHSIEAKQVKNPAIANLLLQKVKQRVG